MRISLIQRLSTDFHELHEANYGHSDPTAKIEVVNLRCVARGTLYTPPNVEPAVRRSDTPTAREKRDVWFDREQARPTAIYDRSDLLPGHTIVGPAVVEQMDTTTLVHPGTRLSVDSGMNLLLELRS